MSIQQTATPMHWNYFLALEEDVVRLSRYLELTTDNFDCYSVELARILFAAASEVDVVAKQLCRKQDANSKADNMHSYRKEISPACPEIAIAQVHLPKFGLSLNPWEQWSQQRNPLWWKAYNNVKHERHVHFSEASLKHSLNAVSGLLVVLLYFYREEGQNGGLVPDPKVFRAGMPFVIERQFYDPYATIYQLPGARPDPTAPGAT